MIFIFLFHFHEWKTAADNKVSDDKKIKFTKIGPLCFSLLYQHSLSPADLHPQRTHQARKQNNRNIQIKGRPLSVLLSESWLSSPCWKVPCCLGWNVNQPSSSAPSGNKQTTAKNGCSLSLSHQGKSMNSGVAPLLISSLSALKSVDLSRVLEWTAPK